MPGSIKCGKMQWRTSTNVYEGVLDIKSLLYMINTHDETGAARSWRSAMRYTKWNKNVERFLYILCIDTVARKQLNEDVTSACSECEQLFLTQSHLFMDISNSWTGSVILRDV